MLLINLFYTVLITSLSLFFHLIVFSSRNAVSHADQLDASEMTQWDSAPRSCSGAISQGISFDTMQQVHPDWAPSDWDSGDTRETLAPPSSHHQHITRFRHSVICWGFNNSKINTVRADKLRFMQIFVQVSLSFRVLLSNQRIVWVLQSTVKARV